MAFTQQNIDDMCFEERCAAAAYKLGWQTPPSGMAWNSWGPGWRDYIRWIFFPILDPRINTQPRTVYCGSDASNSTILVAEAIADAQLNDNYQNEHDALGACLAAWSGL
jgi:hypothetical protein